MSKAQDTVTVGAILKSANGQYTKVVNVRNGLYGISGWSNRENAERATSATKFVNAYGLRFAGVTVAKAGESDSEAPSLSDTKAPVVDEVQVSLPGDPAPDTAAPNTAEEVAAANEGNPAAIEGTTEPASTVPPTPTTSAPAPRVTGKGSVKKAPAKRSTKRG